MLNKEAFELIEQRKEQGVTALYLHEKLGMSEASASSWLSKWARRGFLKFIRYKDTPTNQMEKLERLERVGTLGKEEEDHLKDLRAWRLRVHLADRGRAGRPPQGKYVLGKKEWNQYAHGKLEERMAIRDGTKRW